MSNPSFLEGLNGTLTSSTALAGAMPANLRTAADVYSQDQVDALLEAKAPLASPTFTGTVSGITSTMVGLGNVDNTTDLGKPVSTATQTALDGKVTSVVAGTNISVDNTDPKNPIVSSTSTDIAASIVAATGKTTPVDADLVGLVDSAASNVLKSLTWANIKATIKTTYDTYYQPLNAKLVAIAALSSTDSNIIVGDGTTWVAESGATARTSLGLGTGDSPQFTAVNIGAASDTTITRVAAGSIAVEGSTVLLAGTEDQTVTGGGTVTSKSLGTQSSGTLTLDMGDRALQHYTNNGAHTLAPGTPTGACLVDITNGASAGAITTSGWTKVAGDSFTTTNAHKFRCHCSVGNGGSLLVVQAMQ